MVEGYLNVFIKSADLKEQAKTVLLLSSKNVPFSALFCLFIC